MASVLSLEFGLVTALLRCMESNAQLETAPSISVPRPPLPEPLSMYPAPLLYYQPESLQSPSSMPPRPDSSGAESEDPDQVLKAYLSSLVNTDHMS